MWDDIRGELAKSASGQGASLREVEGPFGPSWPARSSPWARPCPGQPPPPPVRTPARFLGVDGPRWFLRGTLTGPAGPASPGAAARARAGLPGVVVVRGTEPMPVRDPLPLTLPAQAAEQMAAQLEAQAAEQQAGGPAPA